MMPILPLSKDLEDLLVVVVVVDDAWPVLNHVQREQDDQDLLLMIVVKTIIMAGPNIKWPRSEHLINMITRKPMRVPLLTPSKKFEPKIPIKMPPSLMTPNNSLPWQDP